MKLTNILLCVFVLCTMVELPIHAQTLQRPIIQDGTLKTADGLVFHGAPFFVSPNWTAGQISSNYQQFEDYFAECVNTYYMNAVRIWCYMPTWQENVSDYDYAVTQVVQWARDNGIYVLLNLHTHPGRDFSTSDMNKMKEFWTYYGNKYKNDNDIIFELMNEPSYTQSTFGSVTNANQQLYNHVRNTVGASNTHIVLFSVFNWHTRGNSVFTNVNVDWSKTILGFHSYDLNNQSQIALKWDKGDQLRDLGFPVLNTEMHSSVLGQQPPVGIFWEKLLINLQEQENRGMSGFQWKPEMSYWYESSDRIFTPEYTSRLQNYGITYPWNTTSPGNNTIRVRAKGNGSGGAGAQIRLTVGGTTVSTWTLGTSYQIYDASTSLTGDILVEYFNDISSRDVQVDYVEVDGPSDRRQSEAMPENTAAWVQGGGCGAGTLTELMHCNGHINYGSIGGGSSEFIRLNNIDASLYLRSASGIITCQSFADDYSSWEKIPSGNSYYLKNQANGQYLAASTSSNDVIQSSVQDDKALWNFNAISGNFYIDNVWKSSNGQNRRLKYVGGDVLLTHTGDQGAKVRWGSSTVNNPKIKEEPIIYAQGISKMSVYPNPSNGQISLQYGKFGEEANWQLYNYLGQLTRTGVMYGKLELTIENPGVYILVVSRNGEMESQKIIVN